MGHAFTILFGVTWFQNESLFWSFYSYHKFYVLLLLVKKSFWKLFELNFKVAVTLQPMLGGYLISVFKMTKPYQP
jgi:hypothetical protein